MYTCLRHHDQLPTVGLLQVLLNRGIAGPKLTKDGVFGGSTRAAVMDFQRARNLVPDGVVAKKTWPRVIAGTGFRIVDAVDITDPEVFDTDAPEIRRADGTPALVGANCRGIEDLILDLRNRMKNGGEVVLLRFFGQASAAAMAHSEGVSQSRVGGRRLPAGDGDTGALTPDTIDTAADTLGLLTPCFGAYCSVELHGCRVARGNSGRQLLQRLANIWHVPVSAAVGHQFAGGVPTFRFEGPVYTAFPESTTLKDWSKRLPDLVGVTVP